MYSVLDTWHRNNPGRMVKIGCCLTSRLNKRPFDNAQYNTKYFVRDEVFVIKKNITSTEEALKIESCNIQYAKNVLKIGVNKNTMAALGGATYSKDETGAVYAVPVVPKYKNQESFFNDHVSYYKGRKLLETDETFVKHDTGTRKKQDPSTRKEPKKRDPNVLPRKRKRRTRQQNLDGHQDYTILAGELYQESLQNKVSLLAMQSLKRFSQRAFMVKGASFFTDMARLLACDKIDANLITQAQFEFASKQLLSLIVDPALVKRLQRGPYKRRVNGTENHVAKNAQICHDGDFDALDFNMSDDDPWCFFDSLFDNDCKCVKSA